MKEIKFITTNKFEIFTAKPRVPQTSDELSLNIPRLFVKVTDPMQFNHSIVWFALTETSIVNTHITNKTHILTLITPPVLLGSTEDKVTINFGMLKFERLSDMTGKMEEDNTYKASDFISTMTESNVDKDRYIGILSETKQGGSIYISKTGVHINGPAEKGIEINDKNIRVRNKFQMLNLPSNDHLLFEEPGILGIPPLQTWPLLVGNYKINTDFLDNFKGMNLEIVKIFAG